MRALVDRGSAPAPRSPLTPAQRRFIADGPPIARAQAGRRRRGSAAHRDREWSARASKWWCAIAPSRTLRRDRGPPTVSSTVASGYGCQELQARLSRPERRVSGRGPRPGVGDSRLVPHRTPPPPNRAQSVVRVVRWRAHDVRRNAGARRLSEVAQQRFPSVLLAE